MISTVLSPEAGLLYVGLLQGPVCKPTIGEDPPHRTIIYLFWAAGGLLSIECLRFPRARGPARVAENSPQTHNRGAWVPCLCPWRRLGVAPAAQGRRLNLFIYLINFMSVETTFNGPRTIRFEILIPTLSAPFPAIYIGSDM